MIKKTKEKTGDRSIKEQRIAGIIIVMVVTVLYLLKNLIPIEEIKIISASVLIAISVFFISDIANSVQKVMRKEVQEDKKDLKAICGGLLSTQHSKSEHYIAGLGIIAFILSWLFMHLDSEWSVKYINLIIDIVSVTGIINAVVINYYNFVISKYVNEELQPKKEESSGKNDSKE